MEEPKIKRNNGRGERDYEGYPSENAPTFEKIKFMIEIAKRREMKNHEFLLRFGWGLALRANEIINLRVCKIDFKKSVAYIPSEITKGKRYKSGKEKKTEGFVPIKETSLVTAILDRIETQDLNPNDYIFCYSKKKKKYSSRRLNYMMHEIGELAGIPYMHLHLLRHSRAKWLLENGFSMSYVQHFLRHEKAATTQDNYTRYSNDDMLRLTAVGKAADL